MSEYQYYEFQAIDRPLAAEEQQTVAQLSSRVAPHPWSAVFVYHWSSFRGNSKEILAKYYDAMMYMANWGSRRIMFRFPQSALDLERVTAYCQPLIVEDYISWSTVGEHVILNIEFHDEEGGGWVDGEGWLPAMLSLRDDILRGDYRALYLAWLKTLQWEDLLDSVPEPPVPPGLNELTPAHGRPAFAGGRSVAAARAETTSRGGRGPAHSGTGSAGPTRRRDVGRGGCADPADECQIVKLLRFCQSVVQCWHGGSET